MIVKMKRLTLLCLTRDRLATLDALQQMGVVHVTDVAEPGGVYLEKARTDVEEAVKALDLVDMVIAKRAGEKSGKATDENGEAKLASPTRPSASSDILAMALALQARRREAVETLSALRSEIERVAPLGDFEPSLLRQLERDGVHVCLFQTPRMADPKASEGMVLAKLGEDERHCYYALVGVGAFRFEELDVGMAANEIRVPSRSLGEVKMLVAQQEAELAEVENRLFALEPQRDQIVQRVRELEERVDLVRVREGMGDSTVVSYLEGYVPERAVEALKEAASERGWGIAVENPRRGESVPTLIHYPRAIKPIKVVFDVLKIMPSYWESDVSWTFLVFFNLFVGLLIGDAGYGFLFLAVSVFVGLRFKNISRSTVAMLYMMSLSVIVFGVLSGSWLGIQNLPSFLESLRVDWLSDSNNVMGLCFLIGAIHLTIAHAWNALTEYPRVQYLAQIGWIAIVWSMFFLARAVVLGYSFPGFVTYVLVGGVLLVLLFMTPLAELRQNMMNHVLLPLTLVNFFVDVISYVRLFAVGVATVAVMESFNGMAASVGFGSVLTAIFAVIILIFGHSLNLVLCALAVLVHGVRLNTLEFSTHKGLSWSGYLFQPFARKS